ncbi:DUF3307 domain-containing protein [Tannockella kyphosi]|uniref:DUF3307 domain-containing protein n=1 Tax=Tannockella kyphosi TaxID=2899121 RepID=UPI0020131A3F|nr:DUF3307 domain-containing protein [Tannockella kyphosi]
MLTQALFVMFIAHFLGDYILTTGEIANGKSSEYYYTFLHCVLYTLIHYAGCLFLGITVASFMLATVISLSHAIVDFIKSYITINKDELMAKGIGFVKYGKFLYMADQHIHYFLTFLFCDMFASQLGVSNVNIEVCRYILFFAIMWQPTYVTYRVLTNTGYMIGNPFETKDSLLKIYILVIGLCYVINPLLVILPIVIYFVFNDKLKNKIKPSALLMGLIISVYASFWLDFFMSL